MCGIAGVAGADGSPPIDESRLIAMCDAIAHRGPDDSGYHLAPGIALGSRRLAILDLSERGHMPMSTPDGRYWIVYNGEIYNYKSLRNELAAQGHAFRSDTDTEVVLQLYAAHGPAMLDRLNGMFALAIWDSRERSLFLARDRLGIKPLYYAVRGDALYFASEAKALAAAGLNLEFDSSTWEELLCFRYVAGEQTPFVGIRKLLPGHHLTWEGGSARIRRWWDLRERAQALGEDAKRDPKGWFQGLFDESVDLRRISDVPVGVLLSGGLDSSSVAASLASQAGAGIASFTVRFSETGYDEGPLARQVADRWRLEAHEYTVAPRELPSLLREAAYLNDEPFAHCNELHILAISRYAKPRVTVLLSGEGSDEVLGGYVRYRPLRHPGLLHALRPLSSPLLSAFRGRRRIAKLARFLKLGTIDRFVLHNACDVLPGDLERVGLTPEGSYPYREQILSEARGFHPDDYVRQAMYLDIHTFLVSLLDRNDRMTMGASIECRVPFLDYRLVEGLAALPSTALRPGKRKFLLRGALGSRLPTSILKHRKWGFGVPWHRYLRQDPELSELVRTLPLQEPVRNGPFDRRKVEAVVQDYLSGNDGNTALVQQMVMISLWHSSCCKPYPGPTIGNGSEGGIRHVPRPGESAHHSG